MGVGVAMTDKYNFIHNQTQGKVDTENGNKKTVWL